MLPVRPQQHEMNSTLSAQDGSITGWMSAPTGVANCPRGLEYLANVDSFFIRRRINLSDTFSRYEANNTYSIRNSGGQKIYNAIENTNFCTRNYCGSIRPFHIQIFDQTKQEVLHMYRSLACMSCWFPCCLQRVQVSAPPGQTIGSIEQEWNMLRPSFRVLNGSGDTVLRIEGPICVCAQWFCFRIDFNLVSLSGENVGKISKKFTSFTREMFTDASFFGITFPKELDVLSKAVLLGATFLIDFMFFENHGHRGDHHM